MVPTHTGPFSPQQWPFFLQMFLEAWPGPETEAKPMLPEIAEGVPAEEPGLVVVGRLTAVLWKEGQGRAEGLRAHLSWHG